ncbi:MAG: phage baseplate assembly protein V [Candidatus Bathyarchaeota archaeon]|nr:phage baseplate assembly protein V [Candidatus Termiticorpusculum sp.]
MNNNNSSNSAQRFFGKYRGTVTDNQDPLKLGRIRAKVPVIFGENDSGWALPCTPYAGKKVGFFFIPPVDAMVWIEFESGNPQIPIWTGCFWGKDDTPDETASPDIKILKTETNTITLDDTSGSESITLETESGLKIIMNQEGIELSNSSQKIKIGSSGISINDGALEVM